MTHLVPRHRLPAQHAKLVAQGQTCIGMPFNKSIGEGGALVLAIGRSDKTRPVQSRL